VLEAVLLVEPEELEELPQVKTALLEQMVAVAAGRFTLTYLGQEQQGLALNVTYGLIHLPGFLTDRGAVRVE
jgi:hypothetical protein